MVCIYFKISIDLKLNSMFIPILTTNPTDRNIIKLKTEYGLKIINQKNKCL